MSKTLTKKGMKILWDSEIIKAAPIMQVNAGPIKIKNSEKESKIR